MLRLFLNSKLFWSASPKEYKDDYAIFSLKGSHKIDDLDTLSFTILRTHPMFKEVRLKRATFLLMESSTVRFFGRVSDIQYTYDFRAEVTCEEYFGMFKDDYAASYFAFDYMTEAQATNYDTVDELIKFVISKYDPSVSAGNNYAGINSAWPDLPKIQKGFTDYVGRSNDVQEFDIGGKSFYDILYNEVVSKCGGFFRLRVTGSYIKTNGIVTGYKISHTYIDYLSSEDDLRIDVKTGLLYDYIDPAVDDPVVWINTETDDYIIDEDIKRYDEEVIVYEDDSLEPNDSDLDSKAIFDVIPVDDDLD